MKQRRCALVPGREGMPDAQASGEAAGRNVLRQAQHGVVPIACAPRKLCTVSIGGCMHGDSHNILQDQSRISVSCGFTMLPVRLPHPATAVSPTATSPQCFRFPGLPLGANARPLSCRRSCSLAGETDLRQHAWLSRRRPPRVRSPVTRIWLPMIRC